VIRWAVLTGEYPPEAGGVADYTRLVARGLADAGDAVHVYAPHRPAADPGIETHGLPDHYGPRSLADLERALTARPPNRILVQYVPHAFGYKAMNLPFAAWLALRAKRIAPLWVMFHEVAFPFSWRPAKYMLLAGVHRLMARLLVSAAQRIFVATPAWEMLVRRCAPRCTSIEWLPVPSNIPVYHNPSITAALRLRYAPPHNPLVGHFGTYGPAISRLLIPTLQQIARQRTDVHFLLLGRRAAEFCQQLLPAEPMLAGRLHVLAETSDEAVSLHLQICDLLLQPYPDGVTSRRTTVMAGLAHGVPIVSNRGTLSEGFWTDEVVAVASSPDPEALADRVMALLDDSARRYALGQRGAELYRHRFALEHTIARLREPR
jgi:glycosyltransferase involved in cell wall biosynthesis